MELFVIVKICSYCNDFSIRFLKQKNVSLIYETNNVLQLSNISKVFNDWVQICASNEEGPWQSSQVALKKKEKYIVKKFI
jgi:hypothetical protein